MHRLTRILLNFATALSAALCIATIALWFRGHWSADQIAAGYWDYRPRVTDPGYENASMLLAVHARGGSTVAVVCRGCVAGPTYRHTGPGPGERHWAYDQPTGDAREFVESWAQGAGRNSTRWSFAGVRYTGGLTRTGERSWAASFPDWMPIVAAGVLPACGLLRRARRRLRRDCGSRVCRICGYDLRATPERCPECGRTPV